MHFWLVNELANLIRTGMYVSRTAEANRLCTVEERLWNLTQLNDSLEVENR